MAFSPQGKFFVEAVTGLIPYRLHLDRYSGAYHHAGWPLVRDNQCYSFLPNARSSGRLLAAILTGWGTL